MTLHEIEDALLWCVALNYLLLLVWMAVLVFGHGWFYRLNARFFKISIERFDAVNFAGIVCYKIGIVLLNLVPWIALHLSSAR
jgi:hypothetical protein